MARSYQVTHRPVEAVTCCDAPLGNRGCRGVMNRLTLSRLEEGLGHEGFECGKCHRRLKYVKAEFNTVCLAQEDK